MTLEELPPVLVLHLKRFVFEKTGGCQKLVKNIDYPVDLEISKGAHFIFMKLFYCVHIKMTGSNSGLRKPDFFFLVSPSYHAI